MNPKLFEFALLSLSRRRSKHAFIFIVLTLLLSVSISIFTVSYAVKREANYSVRNLPDITLQKIIGGRQQYADENIIEEIITIPPGGVVSATPRVWGGYYNFEYLNTNLTVIGFDPFDPYTSETLSEITDQFDQKLFRDNDGIIIGEQLYKIIKEIYNKDEFSFQTPTGGEYLTLRIAGVFKSASNMLSTDTVITNTASAAAILGGIEKGLVTDLAVNVGNPQEIPTVVEKNRKPQPPHI